VVGGRGGRVGDAVALGVVAPEEASMVSKTSYASSIDGNRGNIFRIAASSLLRATSYREKISHKRQHKRGIKILRTILSI
jgi:hypothetical protein